ncbi:bifunctional phosphopantothenoylcysteine decarboxylase/phosphopantothenate--cysteine ligase CoaBC [soil metagenome]
MTDPALADPALAGRRIVLGVSGGIAAYKAIEVCRQLVDGGAHVIPILTDSATRFVGAVTFSALASEATHTSLWDAADPVPHTRLVQSADLIFVCPATARLIGSYAAGISDELLTATLLATRAPVVVCPAMHTEMWEHPAVIDNLALLTRRGVTIVAPEVGRLAGGDVGEGRLAEVARIVATAQAVLGPDDFAGMSVLVTAGGTREPIDPVRCLTNRSSGKQGHALAAEAASRGAKVTLVTTADRPVPHGVEAVSVTTAAQMAEAVLTRSEAADVVIMAAAVADFRPVAPAARKLKKVDGVPELRLEPTDDILAALGERKRPGQTLVGFAAETNDVAEHAVAKLSRKGADLIVANDVSAPGAGFEVDTNQVLIIGAAGIDHTVALDDKRGIARAVLDAVLEARDAGLARP